MTRSLTSSLSIATDLWNSSPKPSPKNTMSGFIIPGNSTGAVMPDADAPSLDIGWTFILVSVVAVFELETQDSGNTGDS